jgi:hypothetical protein
MFKISDFLFPCMIIKTACQMTNVKFIDFDVIFEENNGHIGIFSNKMYIGNHSKLSGAFASIIFTYFSEFNKIFGINLFSNDEQEINTVKAILNSLYNIFELKNNLKESIPTEAISQRLYQYQMPWLFFHDIYCPIYELPINNFRIITYNSAYIDISRMFDPIDLLDSKINESFVYLNSEVIYEPIKFASLIISGIKLMGKCPMTTIKEMYDSEVFDKVIGLAKLQFKDQKLVDDFVYFLLSLSNIENKTKEIVKISTIQKQHKFGQFYDGLTTTWWYMGLIEKMLGPVRAPDKETYIALEELRDEIWDKVEKARKEKGLDGLTYEALLRVKDGESKKEDAKLIEKRLSKNRIW